jgi:hypothetical protein
MWKVKNEMGGRMFVNFTLVALKELANPLA